MAEDTPINMGWAIEQLRGIAGIFQQKRVKTRAAFDSMVRTLRAFEIQIMGPHSPHVARLDAIVQKRILGFQGSSGHLEGLDRLRLLVAQQALDLAQDMESRPPWMATSAAGLQKIFIVHGHDSKLLKEVRTFVESCGLDPVVLKEQSQGTRTVVEKLELRGDVGFAVVLLTPDDQHVRLEPIEVRPPARWPEFGLATFGDQVHRARQNVIFEFGYFVGRLGRTRIAALYRKSPKFEIPSDIAGVSYIEVDSTDDWKAALLREFKEAKLPVKPG